jgi:hypothetical protein
MGQAPATYRVKDVQLDEKKSKCGHGQAGAYPGKKGSLIGRVVGILGDHRIFSHQDATPRRSGDRRK